MADRLAFKSHGLPHQAACTLCEQNDEFISQLLTGCAFSQKDWFSVLQAHVHGAKSIWPAPECLIKIDASWLAEATSMVPSQSGPCAFSQKDWFSVLTGCAFSQKDWFSVLQAHVHGAKSIWPAPA
jgi:hypothetical protein